MIRQATEINLTKHYYYKHIKIEEIVLSWRMAETIILLWLKDTKLNKIVVNFGYGEKTIRTDIDLADARFAYYRAREQKIFKNCFFLCIILIVKNTTKDKT